MKKRIPIAILAIFFAIFHWHWSSSSLSLSNSYSKPLGDFLKAEPRIGKPSLMISDCEIRVPWTRYLPFFQFGEVEAVQKVDITYKGDRGPYASAKMKDSALRIGVFPDFRLKRKLKMKLSDFLIAKTDGLNGHHFDIAERKQ